MRIAIDIQSICDPRPSGVGHALLETLRAWPESTDEVILFSIGWRRPQLPFDLAARLTWVHVHRCVPSKLINPLRAMGAVSLEWLIGMPVDAVWFPNTGYLPRTKATVFLTVHDLAWIIMPETYTWVHHIRYRLTRAQWWIRRANHIIVPSQATRDDVVHIFDRDPLMVHIVPHGIDHTAFDARPLPNDATLRQRLGVHSPYILSIATQEPRKNLVSLIEAFNALRSKSQRCSLVLAGGRGGKRRALDRAITASPYRSDILSIGFVRDADRPALLRGALCLCLPSRYEGFGMQVVEAMACGTLVVTACNSSMLEVGQDAALYVRAMNVRELTDVLEQVITDPHLRSTLRTRGLDRAKAFSWIATAKHVHDLLVDAAQL